MNDYKRQLLSLCRRRDTQENKSVNCKRVVDWSVHDAFSTRVELIGSSRNGKRRLSRTRLLETERPEG